MRFSLLEVAPDDIPNELLLPAEMGIPKPQHPHAVSLQPRVPCRIQHPLLREPVLTAIQLDVQTRFQAEEIQNVWSQGMLPSKLISGKPPISQPTPEKLLSPSIMFTQRAGNGGLS
jgi:hypothetical protein